MVKRALDQGNIFAPRKRFAAQNIAERRERIAVRPHLLNVKTGAHFAFVLGNALLDNGHLVLEILELGMRCDGGHGAQEVGRLGQTDERVEQQRFVEKGLDDVEDWCDAAGGGNCLYLTGLCF